MKHSILLVSLALAAIPTGTLGKESGDLHPWPDKIRFSYQGTLAVGSDRQKVSLAFAQIGRKFYLDAQDKLWHTRALYDGSKTFVDSVSPNDKVPYYQVYKGAPTKLPHFPLFPATLGDLDVVSPRAWNSRAAMQTEVNVPEGSAVQFGKPMIVAGTLVPLFDNGAYGLSSFEGRRGGISVSSRQSGHLKVGDTLIPHRIVETYVDGRGTLTYDWNLVSASTNVSEDDLLAPEKLMAKPAIVQDNSDPFKPVSFRFEESKGSYDSQLAFWSTENKKLRALSEGNSSSLTPYVVGGVAFLASALFIAIAVRKGALR